MLPSPSLEATGSRFVWNFVHRLLRSARGRVNSLRARRSAQEDAGRTASPPGLEPVRQSGEEASGKESLQRPRRNAASAVQTREARRVGASRQRGEHPPCATDDAGCGAHLRQSPCRQHGAAVNPPPPGLQELRVSLRSAAHDACDRPHTHTHMRAAPQSLTQTAREHPAGRAHLPTRASARACSPPGSSLHVRVAVCTHVAICPAPSSPQGDGHRATTP